MQLSIELVLGPGAANFLGALAAGDATPRSLDQDVPLMASSSALQDGAHTVWDLPATLRVPIMERARCFPHMKHDMVAPPNDAAAANGEPDALDLYRKPSAITAVFASALAISNTFFGWAHGAVYHGLGLLLGSQRDLQR